MLASFASIWGGLSALSFSPAHRQASYFQLPSPPFPPPHPRFLTLTYPYFPRYSQRPKPSPPPCAAIIPGAHIVHRRDTGCWIPFTEDARRLTRRPVRDKDARIATNFPDARSGAAAHGPAAAASPTQLPAPHQRRGRARRRCWCWCWCWLCWCHQWPSRWRRGPHAEFGHLTRDDDSVAGLCVVPPLPGRCQVRLWRRLGPRRHAPRCGR